MINIVQAKNKLPLEFIQKLYENYSENIANRILEGMLKDRLTTIRVNTIKSNIEEIEEILHNNDIKCRKVEEIKDALIIENARENELEKLDIYKIGKIYLQSVSSMIPPIVLNPMKGERILDLTAAPGSKTTQMASLMENEGYIFANEINKIRCERMKYNVEMQGAKIVTVSNCDGRSIGDKFPEYFDKVLLDAPCSGEGRFLLTDKNTYKNWSEVQVKELVSLQKELLKSATQALKQGGTLVYSTCTLNSDENEEMIKWATKYLGLILTDVDIKIKGTIKSLRKCLKILPNKEQEGFFVAKLIKEKI